MRIGGANQAKGKGVKSHISLHLKADFQPLTGETGGEGTSAFLTRLTRF